MRLTGFEPARLSALPPQSRASANSATTAKFRRLGSNQQCPFGQRFSNVVPSAFQLRTRGLKKHNSPCLPISPLRANCLYVQYIET